MRASLHASRALLALLVGGALAVSAGATPVVRADEVPANLRAAILLRALGYERRLASGEGEIRLMVVSPQDGPGREEGTEMARAFHTLARRLRIADRPMRVSFLAAETREGALRAVRARRADVVYVARGLRLGAEGRALARQGHLLVCGHPEAIAEGCVIGVELAQGRSRLVVHLPRAHAGRFRFDGRLLRLARVIR